LGDGWVQDFTNAIAPSTVTLFEHCCVDYRLRWLTGRWWALSGAPEQYPA
jgi:hypothetical protein